LPERAYGGAGFSLHARRGHPNKVGGLPQALLGLCGDFVLMKAGLVNGIE
jgi:hypothetical protein